MEVSQLAVPSVYALIIFLGYPSQWLFMCLEPEPLSKNELILANVLLVCLLVTYTKSVFVDAGRIPRGDEDVSEKEIGKANGKPSTRKWCRKCDAAKPPRAHHCKECKRQDNFLLSKPSNKHGFE